MTKIELEIVALSSNMSPTHAYGVLLGEVNGLRRIPIAIGGFEAQAIMTALERLPTGRPLTHDLFTNFMSAHNIELVEVIICKLEEGIFYANLVCSSNEGDILEIDSRTSDALALAIRAGCKIYTYEPILEAAGISIENGGEQISPSTTTDTKGSKVHVTTSEVPDTEMAKLNLDELNTLLQQVLEQEDYSRAIRIRDEINGRK